MENEVSDKNKRVEQLQKKPGKNEFLIVGIGASAGGITALQEFFRFVPGDSGMAYVVILHLSPDHDSQLAAVLQRETKIPVTQVTEKTLIKPHHIYVVPPNKHLAMEDGYITVSPNVLIEERRAPVDIFFRTLADEHGPRSVAVILSGTGANGSMGLKRIKERGGACFVQNPKEAEFNEMPRNSIATGMVDEILSVAEIPAKILAYKLNQGSVEITRDAENNPEDEQQSLREIFTLLRIRTSHDFTNYKRPTLMRRIERRINIRNLPNLPAYSKFLKEHPDEPTALLKDLLISVTNFFRDKKAFELVEHEIIPEIFKNKTNENQVRIWVAGCATGEEAYSLAMLCAEKIIDAIDTPKVQIFATDIDESAIAHAREGLYTLNDAADVSPERLRRFFNKEGDAYRVRREIREMIMFATHNFLKDPPFSHLDMVSCRNVMIYLNQVAQERVMDTFHFALNPGAFLLLGSSESVDGTSDLYSIYNRENHVFKSRHSTPRSYPVPDSTPSLYFEKFKKDISSQEKEKKILERISFGDLHQQLLEEYAPPSLVINEDHDILHLTEKVGHYLQVGGGELSQNLLKLVRPELRLELRSALYQAVQQKSAVEVRGLKLITGDKTEILNIHVRPVLRSDDTSKGFILIVFEITTDESDEKILMSSDEPLAKQLEQELIRIKVQLRASNEQHDFQAEEMKASNEELQAMNEELRSAAEELETSKEELQSINEEMRTVNQELKVKIEETSIVSNNLQNLINSTDIGTIFLDRSLRVVLYTPLATAIFNLIPADIGRPLSDITSGLIYSGIQHDAEIVLDKLIPLKKDVLTKEGTIFLMHITPYRTDEDKIKGVVITFVNITDRRKTEEALNLFSERYRIALESAKMGTWDWDVEKDEMTWNEQLYILLGLDPDTGKKSIADFLSRIHIKDRPKVTKELNKTAETGKAFNADFRVLLENNETRWLFAYGSAVAKQEHKAVRMAGVAFDITERKNLEQQKQDFLSIASHELKTPVTSIKAYGELLQLSFEQDKSKEDILLIQKMNAQINRLNALIFDLLDTTRIAEGELKLDWTEFDLSELIVELSGEMEHLSKKHTLEISGCKKVIVYADRSRIEQVINNLISNAIKYSPAGGLIQISCEAMDDEVKVSIADQGIGVPEELREKIFDRFFRIQGLPSDTFPGMGLGLYITAGIVKRHGGTIGVTGNEGNGSVFYFTIKRKH